MSFRTTKMVIEYRKIAGISIFSPAQTDPNSFIQASYFLNGTACADDFVVVIDAIISSTVIGPGLGILLGSTY